MSTRQLNNRAETPTIFMVDLALHNIVVKRLKKLISRKGSDISTIAQNIRQSHQYVITHIGSNGGFMQLCYCDSISQCLVSTISSIVLSSTKTAHKCLFTKKKLHCNRFLINGQAFNHIVDNSRLFMVDTQNGKKLKKLTSNRVLQLENL